MRKIFSIVLVLLFALHVANCSSAEVPAVDPNVELVKQLNKELEALEIEGFEPDKTNLNDKVFNEWSKKGIPGLKSVLPRVPGGYTLKVTGHADPYGGLEKANQIAEGRAKFIKEKLAKPLGADAAKLGIKSYGTAEYEQEKNQSTSKNRRVEFEVSK